jgi:hypothetical protein
MHYKKDIWLLKLTKEYNVVAEYNKLASWVCIFFQSELCYLPKRSAFWKYNLQCIIKLTFNIQVVHFSTFWCIIFVCFKYWSMWIVFRGTWYYNHYLVGFVSPNLYGVPGIIISIVGFVSPILYGVPGIIISIVGFVSPILYGVPGIIISIYWGSSLLIFRGYLVL